MRYRLAALACLLPLITGCAVFTKPKDQLCFDRVGFMAAYFQARGDYRLLLYQRRQECVGKEAAPACVRLEALNAEFTRLDRDVLRAFRDQRFEVDWEKVFETLGVIAGLAGKAL